MSFNEFLQGLRNYHQAISELRQDAIRKDLGIQLCPYYDNAECKQQFGLFKPFARNFSTAKELYTQAVVNPAFAFAANLYLSLLAIRESLNNIYLFLQKTMGVSLTQKEEESTFLLTAAGAFFMSIYYAVHAIIDPLWELLAAITRTGATIIDVAQSAASYLTQTSICNNA